MKRQYRTRLVRIAILVLVGWWGILRPLSAPFLHLSFNACVNDLRYLTGAAAQYAVENSVPLGTKVSLDSLKPYLRTSFGPKPYPWICPVGGVIATEFVVGQIPTCSLAEEDPERHDRLQKKMWDEYGRTQTWWWRVTHPRSQW